MSAGAREDDDWHWLWETYVGGLCVAACVGVVMLNHRFPGNYWFSGEASFVPANRVGAPQCFLAQ